MSKTIDDEILALETKLATLKKKKVTWPKRVNYYTHNDRETNWNIGEDIGLSKEVITKHFQYTACEIEFVLSVQENGYADVIEINGWELKDPVPFNYSVDV